MQLTPEQELFLLSLLSQENRRLSRLESFYDKQVEEVPALAADVKYVGGLIKLGEQIQEQILEDQRARARGVGTAGQARPAAGNGSDNEKMGPAEEAYREGPPWPDWSVPLV